MISMDRGPHREKRLLTADAVVIGFVIHSINLFRADVCSKAPGLVIKLDVQPMFLIGAVGPAMLMSSFQHLTRLMGAHCRRREGFETCSR
jgi:hypothetical protein